MRLLRRRQGLRHGAHAGILPDVTLVENLDGGRQRDGQQRADQAAQDKRPDQHGEHDRERMKLHGIPHDFRLDDPSVKLVDGQEDAGNDQHVLEVSPRKPGQQDRGNEGGDDAQVGHDAQHADRRADGDGVRQAEQFQADGDQDAFNDAHQHLAAEEGNQVSVDFLHGVHHVLSEFGGLQRQDAGPFLPDLIRFQQKIKGENGRDQDAHHDAYGAVKGPSAGSEPAHQLVLVKGGIDGHVRPQFFPGGPGVSQVVDLRVRIMAGIQFPQAGAVNAVNGAGDEGNFNGGVNQLGGLVPELHPVVDQLIRLPDQGREDSGAEAHQDGQSREHDRDHGPGAGESEVHQPGDDGFQQVGHHGGNRDGQEHRFQKAQEFHHFKDDEGRDAQHHQDGDARQGVPAGLFLEG